MQTKSWLILELTDLIKLNDGISEGTFLGLLVTSII